MGGQQLVSRMKGQQTRQRVEQAVKQEQSLEMVQSLLLVSVSQLEAGGGILLTICSSQAYANSGEIDDSNP